MHKKIRLRSSCRKYAHHFINSMFDEADADYIKTPNYIRNAEREQKLYNRLQEALPTEFHPVLLRYSDTVTRLIVDHAEYFYFRGLRESNIFIRWLMK